MTAPAFHRGALPNARHCDQVCRLVEIDALVEPDLSRKRFRFEILSFRRRTYIWTRMLLYR